MKQVWEGYKQIFGGLFALVCMLPAAVVIVAIVTVVVKLLLGIVLFIWG